MFLRNKSGCQIPSLKLPAFLFKRHLDDFYKNRKDRTDLVENQWGQNPVPAQDTDKEKKNGEAIEWEKEDSKMGGLETLGILALLIGIIGIVVLLKSRNK
ncbi:hypothetical protein [uncultured Nitrospira sp.]|uniref:hypothetical protein n=1 Tax=uncultured Nitrospira sp. TaxID=157176 RepID=UPI0031408741